MPAQFKDLDIGGTVYRLHRLRGFRAAEAQWELVNICGEGAVAILSTTLMTAAQARKLAGTSADQRRMVMLAICSAALQRGGMRADGLRVLVTWFLIDHLEVLGAGPEGEDVMITSIDDLDALLGGDDDAQVWSAIVWTQIENCLGPIIAASGTGDGSPLTA